jgi:EAL domain-containing protein (putative c-di-GMP-specific phosphodiesterase class I)
MAVNVSAIQFHEECLVGTVRAALDVAAVSPECLELEITESVAMMDAKWTTTVLRALRGMGVRISIDDFGTGQSSLSYLQRFPLSTLKIDRSFIREIGVDGDAEAIVKAVIALAHTLKLKVIAEGVETTRQLAFLRRARCEEGQGFLFGRPAPAQALGEALRNGASAGDPTAG